MEYLSGAGSGIWSGRRADNTQAELSNVYTRNMYIKGRPINDSFHFGQTLINDYGRPTNRVSTRWMGFRPGPGLSPLA